MTSSVPEACHETAEHVPILPDDERQQPSAFVSRLRGEVAAE